MKMIYPRCCMCEEELYEGETVYSGMNGYYCSECLRSMTAEELLIAEGDTFDTAEPVAPPIDIDEAV